MSFFLIVSLWGFLNQNERRDAEGELRGEDGEEGREVAVDGEDRAYAHENNESEREGDAYGQVDAQSATCLARGNGDAYKGHDDESQRVEESLVKLQFGGSDGA